MTAAHTIATTRTSTSSGNTIATTASPVLRMSSTVLSTGAAIPAVVTLAAGRTVVFVRWTTNATTTPTAIGTH